MALYQLIATNAAVIRTTDGATIPNNPENRDYAAYLTWLALGNTPDPYVPPTPDPLSLQIVNPVFQVLFNHENRIRVLESRATLTSSQFRAALVILLGG